MKQFLFFPFLFLALAAAATTPATEFYLWQRRWTPAVVRAAEQCGSPLQVFFAEISRTKTERAQIPPELRMRENVTAVFRLRADALNPEGFARLAAEISRSARGKIQIDADVPERDLAEYAASLNSLKHTLPRQVKELSITALPCHLKQEDFAAVAAQVDYYVLQLHGLNVPARIDEPYALIDGATARTAIRRARRLGRPFRIALPSYAYRLEFDATGTFRALAAEGGSPRSGARSCRLAAPKPELLAALIRENPDVGRIWFRLPVRGDQLCYDLASIEAFERGAIPAPHLDVELRRVAKNALELWITPHAQLRLEPLEISLEWPCPRGEFELAFGTECHPRKPPFGFLPAQLRIDFPGCGTKVRVATFLVGPDNHPVIKERN